MSKVANILWLILGGGLLFLLWALTGLILCVTIIGIPFGIPCFKFARLMLTPFGHDIRYGNGLGSLILNLVWIVFFGVELAGISLVIGLLWCISVVGIPVGLQCFKFARLALLPFGAEIVKT